jgi:hypothetical protein
MEEREEPPSEQMKNDRGKQLVVGCLMFPGLTDFV